MQGPHILQYLYSSEAYVYWKEVVNILKDNNMAQWGCSQFCINNCEEVSLQWY
jgi:aromatic ring-opening dioxygenase LigB subunit